MITRTKHFVGLLIVLLIMNCTNNLIAQKNINISLGDYKELGVDTTYLTTGSIGMMIYDDGFGRFGTEVNIYKFWSNAYSSIGVGLRPVVQFSLFHVNNFRFLYEAKGGIIYMFPEYPKSAVNYTFFSGISSEVSLHNKSKVRFGFGYNHFSNGKSKAIATNNTWDGVGFNIDWMFGLKKAAEKQDAQLPK